MIDKAHKDKEQVWNHLFAKGHVLHFILFSREIWLSRLEIILLRLVITQKLF